MTKHPCSGMKLHCGAHLQQYPQQLLPQLAWCEPGGWSDRTGADITFITLGVRLPQKAYQEFWTWSCLGMCRPVMDSRQHWRLYQCDASSKHWMLASRQSVFNPWHHLLPLLKERETALKETNDFSLRFSFINVGNECEPTSQRKHSCSETTLIEGPGSLLKLCTGDVEGSGSGF